MVVLFLLSMVVGCKKKSKVIDTDVDNNSGIAPASVTSDLRLVEVLPSVVDVGVRTEATVMGVGFTEYSVLYIDDQISSVDNIVYQGDTVLEFTIPSLSKGMHNLRVENPDGETHTLYGAIEVDGASSEELKIVLPEVCRDFSVYFSSANSSLNTEALQLLSENTDCFDNRYVYEIEGHCDERGTTEYNLSLGQRRAEIVQNHLLSLGILPDRISTVSYGEERPAASGSGDDIWSQNRRAVIRVQD